MTFGASKFILILSMVGRIMFSLFWQRKKIAQKGDVGRTLCNINMKLDVEMWHDTT